MKITLEIDAPDAGAVASRMLDVYRMFEGNPREVPDFEDDADGIKLRVEK